MQIRTRKNVLFSALILATLVAAIPSDAGVRAIPASGSADTVYITASGKRYHRKECRYAENASPVTREEAEGRGLTPCKVCKP